MKYRQIRVNGNRVYEHRYVMELHLGRPLLPDEVVHHKDGDKPNNSPSNLQVLSGHAEHRQHHRTRFSSDTHKECSQCNQVKHRNEFSAAGKSGHNTDPHQAYCRDCAAAKAAARKESKRGTCPRCGRDNLYLVTKGMCGGCNATLWSQANPEKAKAFTAKYRSQHKTQS